MNKLEQFRQYSRRDVHDILSPTTPFKPQTGTWGLQGIVHIKESKADFAFFVTYGYSQGNHVFDEGIDENGVLTWQSQPKQKLSDTQIRQFIRHNDLDNHIYLFLRSNKQKEYTYIGELAYIDHDIQREQPVYFKWLVLNWDNEKACNALGHDNIQPVHIKKSTKLVLDKLILHQAPDAQRSFVGSMTADFKSQSINFKQSNENNTKIGNAGEDAVVELERKRLTDCGYTDLANRVVATREYNNAAQYDILSYENDGTPRYIEVKTTSCSEHNPFYISSREVEFSRDKCDQYYLYRLYNFDIESGTGDYYVLKGAIDGNHLVPINYRFQV